uniref:Uncharacterized protein n=1 Tax=Oncorhynchus tshawytscha TaxID=74940 RepID=A0A8C8MCI6_ONCTS
MLPTDLIYSEQRPGACTIFIDQLCGCIELSRIKCVEIVCSEVPIPYSNKYPFQVVHDNLLSTLYYKLYDTFEPPCLALYLISLSCHEETKCNALLLKYYPNFWMEGRWRCCYQTEKMATGCQEYDSMGYSTASTPQCNNTISFEEHISHTQLATLFPTYVEHFLAAFPSLCVLTHPKPPQLG